MPELPEHIAEEVQRLAADPPLHFYVVSQTYPAGRCARPDCGRPADDAVHIEPSVWP